MREREREHCGKSALLPINSTAIIKLYYYSGYSAVVIVAHSVLCGMAKGQAQSYKH